MYNTMKRWKQIIEDFTTSQEALVEKYDINIEILEDKKGSKYHYRISSPNCRTIEQTSKELRMKVIIQDYIDEERKHH